MNEQIAKSAFWIVWSRGGVQLLSFLNTLLIARWLSPSDYGLMALAGIWTGIIGMVADMGLGWAIVQFQDVQDDELDSCFWMTLFTTGAAYVLLYVLAPTIIARWFRVRNYRMSCGLVVPPSSCVPLASYRGLC